MKGYFENMNIDTKSTDFELKIENGDDHKIVTVRAVNAINKDTECKAFIIDNPNSIDYHNKESFVANDIFGELEYLGMNNGILQIIHTIVKDEDRGHNYGELMMNHMISSFKDKIIIIRIGISTTECSVDGLVSQLAWLKLHGFCDINCLPRYENSTVYLYLNEPGFKLYKCILKQYAYSRK